MVSLMAYTKKYPHIVYKHGVRGKHGVSFSTLSKSQKRFLLEHQNLKEFADNPQALSVVLGLFRGSNNSLKSKMFYDWRQNEIKLVDELQRSYDSIEWTCALSGRPIMATMGDFSAKNFVHPEFWEALEGGVSQEVLKSSIAFRHKCQELLLNQQKELMKVFKKNANPRKRLD